MLLNGYLWTKLPLNLFDLLILTFLVEPERENVGEDLET